MHTYTYMLCMYVCMYCMMLGRRLPPALLHRNALCPYARWFEFLVPNLPPTQLLFFAIPHFNASKSVAAAFVFLVTHQFFFFFSSPHSSALFDVFVVFCCVFLCSYYHLCFLASIMLLVAQQN